MLPELHPDPQLPQVWLGTLTFNGRKVDLRVDPDGVPKEECMASALQAVRALSELDVKAKAAAAAELLPNYNQNWRHFSQTKADGTFEDVHEPELTASSFKQRLTLTSIEAMGNDCYTLFYSDDNMFAGHSVVVTSFDGLEFSNSSAELFG